MPSGDSILVPTTIQNTFKAYELRIFQQPKIDLENHILNVLNIRTILFKKRHFDRKKKS